MKLSDVLGQRVAVSILQRSLETERIAHSYLFLGRDGVGRRTAATAFARHLLCETGESCGVCRECQRVVSDNHPGFRTIGGEGGVGIDAVRELKHAASLRYKHFTVWLIEDAARLSIPAANAFLKTLEEPLGNTVFILTARSTEELLPTVVSRCQIVPFRHLSEGVLRELLRRNAVDCSNTEETELILRMSRGSIGEVLRLKDSDVFERRHWVIEQMAALPTMAVPDILGLAVRWDEGRQTVLDDFDLMLCWYRDLLLINARADSDTLFNLDREEDLRRISRQYSLEALHDLCAAVEAAKVRAMQNVRVRYLLSDLLLQMKKGALI